MGANYTDDHRVLLYHDGRTARDITAFCADVQARDELNALSVELTFRVLVSPRDPYVPRLNIRPGDKVRVTNRGAEVFAGVVATAGLDGGVTAYDPGWYLNESQIILQCAGVAADDAIRQMCAKAGVGAGEICALPAKITAVWVGETPADILADILSVCTRAAGKEYRHRVEGGRLTVRELPAEPIRAYHKPADNLAAFDITWALGAVSGEDGIAETRNAVVLAAESGGDVRIGAQASNAASIQRYGFLQRVETVEQGDTAQLGQQARNLLALSDRVQRTRSVEELWGADEVRSGVVLSFNSPAFGISGRQRVTAVTHQYGKRHRMTLTLLALDEPRAADAADTVKVYGIPDAFFDSAGGTGGGAGDAAAFLSAARGEIGTTETPPGSNVNKYGAWAGSNGVAWCVFFVCWCASQSGAPIPTGYGYVGDMADYFKARGKYRTAASGYVPQPGDLMIQGVRHIGIVESATRAAVQTIEGNCSDSVRRMTQYYGDISGFCTPFA